MSGQLLGLFDIPELPEHDGSKESFRSSNINHFITKILPRTFRTIEFLESIGPEFDQWVEENRGDTDRSFFIEQLSVWRQELLPWRAMIDAAEKCSRLPETQACVHHGGTQNRCQVDLPLMWASNDLALAHLKKVCMLQYKKKTAAEGKPLKNNGEYKISPNRPDLVADVLIESGWRFVVAGAYTRESDGSLSENDKGEHVLMWDYDKKCFTDAFDPNGAGFSAPMRALNSVVAGGLNASFFTVLHRSFVSRLVEAHGQNVFVTDSIPSHIVPVGNGDYNVILQRLYPMSPFHAPKERIATSFEDWSDKEPPRYGTYGKTWDDLLDDWSTTAQGTVHPGRRLHLEQIAYQILLGYGPDYQLFLEMIGQSDEDFDSTVLFDPSHHLFDPGDEEKNSEIEEARVILQRLHAMGQMCAEASVEDKAQTILTLKSLTQNSTYGLAVRGILGQHLYGDILAYSIDLQGENLSQVTPGVVLCFPWDELSQAVSTATLDQLIALG